MYIIMCTEMFSLMLMSWPIIALMLASFLAQFHGLANGISIGLIRRPSLTAFFAAIFFHGCEKKAVREGLGTRLDNMKSSNIINT